MSLLDSFKQEDLLAFYHCAEFFRIRQEDNSQALSKEGLDLYMGQIKKWCLSSIAQEEASFFGGDDEDSQVVLYSSSLNVYVACFALKAGSGTVEPVFYVRKLPDTIRDNQILIACVAITCLRDNDIPAGRVWITTGTEHYAFTPPDENFDRVYRVCSMMNNGEYQVKTGKKCTFCPALDSCEVYKEVGRIAGACSSGPAMVYF